MAIFGRASTESSPEGATVRCGDGRARRFAAVAAALALLSSVLSVAGVAVVASSAAADAGTWAQGPPPPPRYGPGIAYDASAGEIVMFGGVSQGDGYLGDTWVGDGTDWFATSPATAPSVRQYPAMAYDATRHEVVLFGGYYYDGSGHPYNDTWVWDGSSWTQKFPATSPPPRFRAPMVYDAARGEIVLYGGSTVGGPFSWLGDTWTWNGETWTLRGAVPAPPDRRAAAMAYDAARGEVVLFGGNGYTGGSYGADTWIWNGATWTRRYPATSPPGRYMHSMAYDSAKGRVVLFGGTNTSNVRVGDTWTWDGTTWTDQSSTSPGARVYAALTDLPPAGKVLLFGGGGGSGVLGDTWLWDGTAWTQQYIAPTPRNMVGMAYDAARGNVVLFGGSSSAGLANDTWTWGGTGWTRRFPVNSPAARYGPGMAYDAARGRVVLFGGNPGGDDTWTWDGTNWTQEDPATVPIARVGPAMAYDAARSQIVLFGGYRLDGTLGDTWTWDGTNWTQRFPDPSPPARSAAGMAYDAARGRIVLFGGRGSSDLNDTWTWDGSGWTDVSPASSPPARFGAGMDYDSGAGRVVLFGGGYGSNGYRGDTWTWDGVAWTEDFPAVSPSARMETRMAYHPASGLSVLFGGFAPGYFTYDTWLYSAVSGPPKLDQTITVTTGAPASAPYMGQFTVAATASSGLPVAYAASGSCTNVDDTFTMTSGTGACTVTYSQAGDADYNPAGNVTETVSAEKAGQTITVTNPAPSSAKYGSQFTVAATATSGLPVAYAASGSCTNVDDTFTMTSGTGVCTVTYSQAGDTDYNAALDVTETVNGTAADQSITVTTGAPASAPYKGQFTVAATASSGLPVSYAGSGSCTNDGDTFTMTSGTGPCTVTYSQGGNADYNPAPVVTETVNAEKADQSITVTTGAPASAVYGSQFTVAATASSGLPVSYAGSGSCTNDGPVFTMSSGTGVCTVTYSQAGDTDYNAALDVTETVNGTAADQSITVTTGAPASAPYKGQFTVAATASSGLPVSYAGSGSCTNDGPVFTMTSGTGPCTVSYSQGGDADYNPAPVVTETVNAEKADQSITVTTHAPASAPPGSQFTVAATASSGLDVAYAGSGSCTNDGPIFTMASGPGACTVTYSQGGDADYNPAPDVTETVDANVAPVAVADSYSVDEDGVLNPAAGVLANDTDANGDDLTAEVVTVPGHGNLDLADDGSFTYTPSAGWSGTDSFTYRASDGIATAEATVTITVNAVNDPPPAPSAIGQFASDGMTAIPTGGDSGNRTVVFKGTVTDPEGDHAHLVIEIHSVGSEFDGLDLLISAPVAGGVAQVSATLPSWGAYHWRAWTEDATGLRGDPVAFGDNTEVQCDFELHAVTSLLYTGDQIVETGNAFTPKAKLSGPAECIDEQSVSFELDDDPLTEAIDGPYSLGSGVTTSTGQVILGAVSTADWQPGVYTIKAAFAGTASCDPSADEATLTVAAPGDSATGGGWYTLTGNGRVNFGFTVHRIPGTDPPQYKGQALLINNGRWRLKGTLDRYVQAGTSGSASGTGRLYSWDATLNDGLGGWVLAGTEVPFTISFADNGTGGKKATPDTFGIHIAFVSTSSPLPNSGPQPLKGGNIRVGPIEPAPPPAPPGGRKRR